MPRCRHCQADASYTDRDCPLCHQPHPVQQWVFEPGGAPQEAPRPASAAPASLAPMAMARGAAVALPVPAPYLAPKHKWWDLSHYFESVTSTGEARHVVKEATAGFYVIAVLQALFGFFLLPGALVDAALFACFAFWARKTGSRIPAVILFALSGIGLLVTSLAMMGMVPGGRNLVLAVMSFGLGYRLMLATFFLSRHGEPVAAPANAVLT